MNKTFLVFTFILSSSISAPGIVAQGRVAYTLDQCLALAKENNLRLRIAGTAVQSSELSLAELRTTALPQLHIAAGASYAPSSSHVGYDPGLTNGGTIAGQLVLEQSIYDRGLRGVKSSQLELDREQRMRERERDERDVIFSVKQNFYEVLRARRETVLEEENVETLGDYLGLVKGLSKGGIGSYTDVLKTEIQLSIAKLSLQKAGDAFRSAKYSLAETIGVALDTAYDLLGSLDSIAGVQAVSSENSSRTIDIRIAELSIERSSLETELTRHERLPSLSLFADAGVLSSVDNLKLPDAARSSILGYSVGVNVDVPVLNWGATGLRVDERMLATDALRFQAELLRRSIHSDAERTRIDLANARERLRSTLENSTHAEENFSLTKSKYAAGSALSLEVLAAQQLVTDTKLAELQALADIATLTAKLERITSPTE